MNVDDEPASSILNFFLSTNWVVNAKETSSIFRIMYQRSKAELLKTAL